MLKRENGSLRTLTKWRNMLGLNRFWLMRSSVRTSSIAWTRSFLYWFLFDSFMLIGGHAGQISMRLAAGVPVGRSATIELRNQHMTYAITWCVPPLPHHIYPPRMGNTDFLYSLCDLVVCRYALSLATSILFFRLVRKPIRGLTAADYRNISS